MENHSSGCVSVGHMVIALANIFTAGSTFESWAAVLVLRSMARELWEWFASFHGADTKCGSGGHPVGGSGQFS